MNYQTCTTRRLYRSDNALLFGVCGGLAEYFDLPPWGVRLVYLILSIPLFFPMVLLYVALAFVLKKRPALPYSGLGPEEAFWAECGGSRAEALRRLGDRFQALDKRLQRLESIVTSPGFGLEDEYKKL